jgi:hypothetical protein
MKKALALAPVIIASMLALTSCASTWSKPGGTQAEFNKDSYECERDMRQSGGYGTGLVGALNAQGFAGRCMIAHGYTKDTTQSASASGTSPDPSAKPAIVIEAGRNGISGQPAQATHSDNEAITLGASR